MDTQVVNMLIILTLAMIVARIIRVVRMQITVLFIPIAAMECWCVKKHMPVSFIPIAAMDLMRVITLTMSWFTVMAVLGTIRAVDCDIKPFLAGGR